jgi:hypothetical protein
MRPWTSLEEDHTAFLLPAPKCTSCIKRVLMIDLSKTDTKTGFSTGPQVRMLPSSKVVHDATVIDQEQFSMVCF